MTSITIILIVVIALLTVIIFGLTWIAYLSCIRAYRLEVEQGKHDESILEEHHAKKKKIRGLIGIICSYAVLFALSAVFVTGIVYKVMNQNITVNDTTVLVIKSGSMSDFFNETRAQEYNYDASLHYDVGDICIFEKINNDTELTIGDVYGYRYNNNIITHRLITDYENGYEFRGDNNSISDYAYYGKLVQRDEILYHYTGKKIPGIGAFILYAQSYFGMWSLVGMVGITVSSEIAYYKIDSINKKRYKELGGNYEEK